MGLEDLGQTSNLNISKLKEQVTKPRLIQEDYALKIKDVRAGNVDLADALEKSPLPRGTALGNGWARLVLYHKIGVPFGRETQSPKSLEDGSGPDQVFKRSEEVRRLDPDAIQKRKFAEIAATDIKLGSRLIPSVASTLEKQLPIVAETLDAKISNLEKVLNSTESKEIGEILSKSINAIAGLDRLDADMKLGGSTGFISGPANQFTAQTFGVDIGSFFETPAGKTAREDFLAQLPILTELFSRDLLKATGEQRISNSDLKGAQRVLVKINKDVNFNASTLKELRGYLKRMVKGSLDYVGTFSVPESTLKRAAQIGVNVKSIKGKNGFYSPYLAPEIYAVTKEPVPSFSKKYIGQLVDQSIFGYVARKSSSGKNQYQLINVDQDTGLPILKGNQKGYKSTTYPGGDGWQTKVPKKTLEYNRNLLINTYKLDR